ncbi:MAG: histidine kinase [Lachnospiraceae bacterium]|nr:histidine kinase [Lachnospiraceae bacterium]
MNHIIKRFNNLSLHKKIWLIVAAMLTGIYLTFFISIQVLTSSYEKELYQANAQMLSHVSSSITAELQAVEALSNNMVGDSIIQDNLRFLHDNPSSNRKALAKRDIYQGLYPYTFYDDYIKSINIILDDGTNICMGNTSDLERFDIDAMNRNAEEANGRLIWETAPKAGSDVVAARTIRQIKYLTLRKLASLYITIDMEHLIRDSLEKAGYPPETSRFILLADRKRFYPKTPYHDDLYNTLISSMNQQSNTYTIASFEQQKEFIIAGSIPYVKWDYLYFRDYDPLFRNIQAVRIGVFVFSACFGIFALLLVQVVFRHILKHLDFLVEKIRCFGGGLPAPHDRREYDYLHRKDEIGQLHVSFDEMTTRVKVLRDENYDKQILLRDATIKMLQQQINPHFLYNTLDTINWMAQKCGADDISVMARSLGNMFRASITGQDDLIPLSYELSVLDNYIRIQRIRFKDRLVFELSTPKDTSLIYVPKFCIQPLVENALKHAMEYTDEVCTIRVTIRELEDRYQVQVANTGSQFEDDLLWKIEHKQITPQGSGVGLVNIDSRLKLIYGNLYGLTFYNKDSMAIVVLSIPKEREILHAPINDC